MSTNNNKQTKNTHIFSLVKSNFGDFLEHNSSSYLYSSQDSRVDKISVDVYIGAKIM